MEPSALLPSRGEIQIYLLKATNTNKFHNCSVVKPLRTVLPFKVWKVSFLNSGSSSWDLDLGLSGKVRRLLEAVRRKRWWLRRSAAQGLGAGWPFERWILCSTESRSEACNQRATEGLRPVGGLSRQQPQVQLMLLRFSEGTVKNSAYRRHHVNWTHLVLVSGKLVLQEG